MNQSNLQRTRLIILAGYSVATLAALLFVLTKSQGDKLFNFVVFNNWSAIQTDQLRYEGESIPGRRYQEPETHDLAVEIYSIDNSKGETLNFLNRYEHLKLERKDIAIASDSQIGSYGLLTRNNRTQLNTCIHSSGTTAFTTQQFGELANANLGSRMLPWIFGFTDLRDWDCWWVNMSVSLNNLSEPEAQQFLKQRLFVLLREIDFTSSPPQINRTAGLFTSNK
ncbi:hypothetical protein I4641_22185 [Waterburya agarophytonicola K14]|uniref:Uncharacterized protein n=1 Tax=Waterburya agarophytonicola KI4 TaxID=2874699 RepID=A0A964FH56_9CYAN|nr:hypothetical protein [Waterburya agarophytonicola]MCC0179665.1 hypothetical protein [Waterburya agarophytonicola KI4]